MGEGRRIIIANNKYGKIIIIIYKVCHIILYIMQKVLLYILGGERKVSNNKYGARRYALYIHDVLCQGI